MSGSAAPALSSSFATLRSTCSALLAPVMSTSSARTVRRSSSMNSSSVRVGPSPCWMRTS